jgi:hypothetical protein
MVFPSMFPSTLTTNLLRTHGVLIRVKQPTSISTFDHTGRGKWSCSKNARSVSPDELPHSHKWTYNILSTCRDKFSCMSLYSPINDTLIYSILCILCTWAAAQARAEPKPAIIDGFGPAWRLWELKPLKAVAFRPSWAGTSLDWH